MMFYLAWPFCLAIFSLTWNSNTRVMDQTSKNIQSGYFSADSCPIYILKT